MQEFFKLDEVVRVTGRDEEDILRAIMQLGEDLHLTPAYYIETPIDAKDCSSGKRVKIGPGVFEIGVFPYMEKYPDGGEYQVRVLTWDEHGTAKVNLFTRDEPFDFRVDCDDTQLLNDDDLFDEVVITSSCTDKEDSGAIRERTFQRKETVSDQKQVVVTKWDYLPDNSLEELKLIVGNDQMRVSRDYLTDYRIPVPKTHLVIMRESLVAYLQAIGKKVPAELKSKFSPEQYVKERLDLSEPRELIAVALANAEKKHGVKVTQEQIARLLYSAEANIAEGTWQKKGSRLVAKGKKLLAEK